MKKSVTAIFAGLIVLGLMVFSPTKSVSKEESPETIVLSNENTIVLDSQVDGESAAAVIGKAKSLDGALSSGLKGPLGINKDKPLYLFLNTPGGSVQSGLEIVEALRGLGRPVNTITMFSASMGFQLVQNLDKRLILENGVLMSHRAVGQFAGEFGGQSPSQVESRFHLWMKRLTEMDEQTVKRTGGKQTLESYQKQYSSELWLTGRESVEKGYADEIVKVKCDKSLDGTTEHHAQAFGLTITYELDNCPINTSPTHVKIGLSAFRKVAGPDGKIDVTTETMETDRFVKEGGAFGTACLHSNSNNLCAVDPEVNMDRIKEVKDKFMDRFLNKKVVYMY